MELLGTTWPKFLKELIRKSLKELLEEFLKEYMDWWLRKIYEEFLKEFLKGFLKTLGEVAEAITGELSNVIFGGIPGRIRGYVENQHDSNKTNLECGASMNLTDTKSPHFGKTKFAGIACFFFYIISMITFRRNS